MTRVTLYPAAVPRLPKLSSLFSRRPATTSSSAGGAAAPSDARRATLLLIATTGEWTRRRVPDEKTAFDVAGSLGVPVYNVRFTGYPQRMRDWNSRQRRRRTS